MADSELLESIPSDAFQPVRLVAEEEGRRHLGALAAELLSEPQMTAVWLYYVEDMSVKDIARVQGRSRVAVKTMLFRARKKLLPALEGLQPDNPAKDRDVTLKKSSCPTAAEATNG